jgi:fluorothreonine transaldolase
VVGCDGHFTESHTVLIATRELGSMTDLSLRLEQAGIIAGPTLLPEAWGRGGIRLGVQEMTRRGMTAPETQTVAGWIADLLTARRTPEELNPQVKAMALRLNDCRFGLR